MSNSLGENQAILQMLHQADDFMSVLDAEKMAAQHGIRLTASDREQIQKAQQAELKRHLALQQQEHTTHSLSLVEQFNRNYPRFLQLLAGVGEVLLTFTQTVLIAFGVPLVLLLLLVVEQQRVVHGIQLFEADAALAAFAAWALVLLNLVLEFTIEYIETRAGYQPDSQSRFSLRLLAQRMAYTLGISRRWTAQPLSPAARYTGLLRLVTLSILALALAGSMRGVIAKTDGAWYSALLAIFTDSSLTLMVTWLGGLLFAAAAVLAAQGLSRYVAVRCVEILAMMQPEQQRVEDTDEEAIAIAVEAVGVNYILAKIAAKQQQPFPAPGVAGSEVPFLMTTGSGSTTG